MFALQFTEYGGPEVLSVGEAPEPHAGPGQIRIVVRAASVNVADWKFMSGRYAKGKPFEGTGYPGYDASGVVDAVGEGVTDVAVGDDVFGLGDHTQAEYAVLNSWARKPASVDWAVAAAAGVVAETAERVLRLLGVTEGTTLFIDGGAGGVGSATTQIAKARGATVIATAGEANQDYLREIGAIPVVYGEGMVDRVRALDVGKIRRRTFGHRRGALRGGRGHLARPWRARAGGASGRPPWSSRGQWMASSRRDRAAGTRARGVRGPR